MTTQHVAKENMIFRRNVTAKVMTDKQYRLGYTFKVALPVQLVVHHSRELIKVVDPNGVRIGKLTPDFFACAFKVMKSFSYSRLNMKARTSYEETDVIPRDILVLSIDFEIFCIDEEDKKFLKEVFQ